MGSSQSLFADYSNGFNAVETKCKWKLGLVVDVCGMGRSVVTEIRGIFAGPPARSLRIEERLDGKLFIYYYVGKQIVTDTVAPMYEIYLKEVQELKKISGAAEHMDLITFDDEQKTGGCESCGGITEAEDNIADDD